MNLIRIAAVFGLVGAVRLEAQRAGELCGHSIMKWDGAPFRPGQRLELRRCGETEGRLQLVGFSGNEKAPTFLEDSREHISQIYAQYGLFIIELEGGAYRDVFIITLVDGELTLHSKLSYREHFSLHAHDAERVEVQIPGLEIANRKTQMLAFTLDEAGRVSSASRVQLGQPRNRKGNPSKR